MTAQRDSESPETEDSDNESSDDEDGEQTGKLDKIVDVVVEILDLI